mmetsp:Transcript_20208/g.52426  ORF Transcript_20208/g.52426 Transcript_20208/m.52426 type:complete len:298 (+) Transcript_20208:969-1862(+)
MTEEYTGTDFLISFKHSGPQLSSSTINTSVRRSRNFGLVMFLAICPMTRFRCGVSGGPTARAYCSKAANPAAYTVAARDSRHSRIEPTMSAASGAALTPASGTAQSSLKPVCATKLYGCLVSVSPVASSRRIGSTGTDSTGVLHSSLLRTDPVEITHGSSLREKAVAKDESLSDLQKRSLVFAPKRTSEILRRGEAAAADAGAEEDDEFLPGRATVAPAREKDIVRRSSLSTLRRTKECVHTGTRYQTGAGTPTRFVWSPVLRARIDSNRCLSVQVISLVATSGSGDTAQTVPAEGR